MDGKGAGATTSSSSGSGTPIKYEEVYLRAYASVSEARERIGKYIWFYNSPRPHSSLNALTPDQVYFQPPATRGSNPAEAHSDAERRQPGPSGP